MRLLGMGLLAVKNQAGIWDADAEREAGRADSRRAGSRGRDAGAWHGETSQKVGAGRGRGNSGQQRESWEVSVYEETAEWRCVSGRGKRESRSGQPLTPSLGGELRTKQASLSAVPALQCVRLGGAALPEAEALAKSSAEGTSLRGVLRRGVEAPEFLIPAERAATRPTLSVFPAESRPKEKAACVSGGSADRP